MKKRKIVLSEEEQKNWDEFMRKTSRTYHPKGAKLRQHELHKKDKFLVKPNLWLTPRNKMILMSLAEEKKTTISLVCEAIIIRSLNKRIYLLDKDEQK